MTYESVAWLGFLSGDAQGALEAAEEGVRLQREIGRSDLVNRALVVLCQMLVAVLDVSRAEPLAREVLEVADANGNVRSQHFAHHFLADCALIRGDCETAEQRYAESLRLAWELGDRIEISFELQGVAMAAAGRGRTERAQVLAEAAQAMLDSLGADFSGVAFWTELLERYLRDVPGETERTLTFEEAVEFGLDLAADRPLLVGMSL